MASVNTCREPRSSASEAPFNRLHRTTVTVLLLVWVLSVAYMAANLERGWVPHDEGTLGLSAERVVQGQLPHRDFDDYTGGLTFLHALAFKVFGTSSVAMRMVLFAFFIPWVPAIFYIASRFSSAYAAGAVTILAVVWSVPKYPEPMPSWYNLFFATAGTAALLRYVEKDSRRWLFVAGLCGGFSFLAKISAAYFVAGALLFFVFREQNITADKNRGVAARARFYRGTITLGLGIFLFLLFRTIHQAPGIIDLVYFVLPTCGLLALLMSREWAPIAGRDRERFKTLLDMGIPFAMGTAIPLLLFMIPYAIAGATHDLVRGLLAAPARAIRAAMLAPENPLLMISIVPFLLPVLIAKDAGKLGRLICGGIFSLCAGAVVFYSVKSSIVFEFGWCSLATAIPAMTLGGVAILWAPQGPAKPSVLRQQQLMLMISVAALCSLLQFPYSSRGYFCYVAPLAMLAAVAIFAAMSRPPRFVLASLIVFYLLFGLVAVTPYRLGVRLQEGSDYQALALPRAGGLRVEPNDERTYDQLIPLVQAHAAGKFIYAAPDCPEVYFLSGTQSVARHPFGFGEDQAGHTERILAALENLHVDVVAIKKTPRFSGPLSPQLQNALELRYPHSQEVGVFEVRWKNQEPEGAPGS